MARDKILLALQFYDGDKKSAMELARLIAKNEPTHCDKADFLFVSRHDCERDLTAEKDVSRRFDVHSFRSRRLGSGWPHGPNELWFATMEWVYCYQASKKNKSKYKAVLTFEADSCPLRRNWIEELSRGWDLARSSVAGHLLPHPCWHINGNAMFSAKTTFLYWLTRQVAGCPARTGWDVYLAPSFKSRGWKDIPLIRSLWKHTTLRSDEISNIETSGAVFLHGVKDSSVREYFSAKISSSAG